MLRQKSLIFCLLLGTLNIASCGEHDKINGSIRINANEQVEDLSTVNGSIRIGAAAHAKQVETVNGSIHVDASAQVDSLETVNGSITLGENVKVNETIEAVNGAITLDKSADVKGQVSNVNGTIKLTAAHIGGGIETTNGDITIGADSLLEGGILVRKNNGWSNDEKSKPRIVIGPQAVVKGDLIFKREVELLVSDSATIGKIEGATAVKFAGDTPPSN